jgi:hypothetical protein
MSVKEIESAIEQLPPAELSELAQWFEEFHAQAWDRQIERDIKAGKLNRFAEQAKADYAAGRYRPL